jgi:hypothetical protein
MPVPSGRTPQGGLGRLVAITVVFALLAPIASVSVPLAALLLVSRPRTTGEIVATVLAAGLSVWWLLQPGDLPDQLLKATVVLATTLFVASGLWRDASFVHRGMFALGGATAGVSALLPIVGSSWSELRWWVEYRSGVAVREFTGQLGALSGIGSDAGAEASRADQIEVMMGTFVRLTADYYPAIMVLVLLGGLALGTAIYERVAEHRIGRPLARFRLFRFSEHIGWVAVVSLVALLVPKLAAVKLTAANVLLVVGALYALRGLAVAAAGIALTGAGGFFLWALLAVIFLLMLPVFVGGAILVGVLDTGVDFRRRWASPPAGK